jgi:hypothetical protein
VSCSYCGGNWQIGLPCPHVERLPWPRGLVAVPNTFGIVGADVPRKEEWQDWSCDWANNPGPNCPQPDRYRNGIYVSGAYAYLAWQSAPTDPTWYMDDREWNIGQTSDDIMSPFTGHDGQMVSTIMGGDLTIRNTRAGYTITHIYETSSYGKTENGPDIEPGWPAYQVNVTTYWHLVANFKYRTREVETVTENICYETGNPNRVNCSCRPGEPGCNIFQWDVVTEKRNKDTDHTGPSLLYDFNRNGAKVPRDERIGGQCTVIPVPVIQMQTVLSSP